jgi:type IV secretory pathway component VirB8
MWAEIRKEWDYLALVCVLGVYVTAAAAVAITLMLALSQTF